MSGTDLAYDAVAPYARTRTDLAYAPTRCPVLTPSVRGHELCGTELAYGATRCPVQTPMLLRARYAMSSTDLSYAAMVLPVCGTDLAYAATPYAILIWRMLLRRMQY
eukprot:2629473-Rhodomonas_salina.1